MDVSLSVWYHISVELHSGILKKKKKKTEIYWFKTSFCQVFNMASLGLWKMLFPTILLSGMLILIIFSPNSGKRV